jgi:hypothetical protein
MKNSFLLLGGLLVLINSTVGLVFESYNTFNMAMADVSIMLSIGLIYGAYNSAMADGFKIGFTVLFAVSGLIRFICSVVSPEQFKNNLALLVFIIFLSIEFLVFFVGNNLKNK